MNLLTGSSWQAEGSVAPGFFDNLSTERVLTTEPGILIVYVDNQTMGRDVWFDNVQVLHYNTQVLEENHYYPFGLTLSTTAMGITEQPLKYNGKELETSFDLQTYEYGARQYNSQIGRWNGVDPLADKYYPISPFAYVANNPVIFIDPDGKKIKLYGENRDEVLARINKGNDLFKVDENNELVLKDPKSKISGVFATAIVKAIEDAQTVDLKLIAKNDAIFVDAFATGEVDSDDLLNMSDNLLKSNILHFVVERFSLADYEKNKIKPKEEEYKKYHEAGLEAEASFAKELFPHLKNIKYKDAAYDMTSIKRGKDGKGTINYIYDFGYIKQVFLQPIINEKGEVSEHVL